MDLEESVKEHIKDLQQRIKANIIFADVSGRVRHAIFSIFSTELYGVNSVAAYLLRSGWHCPIIVFCKGEETKTPNCRKSICEYCFGGSNHE